MTMAGQALPNPGFETVVLDASNPSDSYPVSWIPFHWANAGLDCIPSLPQGELTTEAHTGDYAIRMETHTCQLIGGATDYRAGGYTTGNTGTLPPLDWSVAYAERPDFLHFHYRFEPSGNDSAYVEVLLFNYNADTPGLSVGERTDTVAYSVARITEASNVYLPFSMPLDYFSEDFPAYVSVVFSSGPKNNCSLATCTSGTTFWVDDVGLSGGTVGTPERPGTQPQIVPNPLQHAFSVEGIQPGQLRAVDICDLTGRSIRNWDRPLPAYPVEDLPSGGYLVILRLHSGVHAVRVIR